jgi:DNA-binding SARP family transcriptional activator/tetratricopeptide (TPR) repeat protein
MERLNLVLFGGFHATLGARPVALPLKKAQALLAFLALAPGHRCARERLAGILWSDTPDEQARNSLRQTLFAIRSALGRSSPRYLAGDGASIWLESSVVDVDVLAFERLASDGSDSALERAADLYGGDLFDGIVVEADAFDEWLVPARERLRQSAIGTMAKLLARQVDRGGAEAAIATGTRLLRLDPLHEIAHRALMRLYAGTGRRVEAIRQYRTCVDVLQRELRAEPESATVELYRALFPEGSEPSTPSHVSSEKRAAGPPTLFVGRDAELSTLAQHLRLAAEGNGRVVALLGEAGMGKTRLTEELIARIRPGEVLVARGRSYESARSLPLALWVEALQEHAATAISELQSLGHLWARDLEPLFPDTRRARPRPARGGDRLRLFEALGRLLQWLAASRPLLVVLDDLHWADDVSLAFLAYLSRRLPSRRIMIAVTARPEEAGESANATLAELSRERCLARLDLGPLSLAATNALVRSLVAPGSAASEVAGLLRHVWKISEGNPFVVTETMRTVAHDRIPFLDTGAALPEAVRAMTQSRLRRLGRDAQRLMALASVIGHEFDFALIQRASGGNQLETGEAIEELVRAHMLRESGDRFVIAHDRIREVVSAEVLAPRRRTLHGAVAGALEVLHHGDLEAHCAELAHHHRAAENWGAAVAHLRVAGAQAAARGAYREAVGFFEGALAALGRLPHSRAHLETALDLRIELRDWLMPLNEVSRLATYVREAAGLARELGDDRRLSVTLGHFAHFEWATGAPRRALDAAEQAAEIAARLDDPALRILANFYLGEVHHSLGNYRTAVDFLRRNVALTSGEAVYERHAGPGLVPVQSRFWLAFALAALGEYREAFDIATAAHDVARAVQHPYSFAFASYAVGRLQFARGAMPEALEALERARELVESREIVQIRPVVNAWLGCARTLAGRPADGIPLIQAAVDRAGAVGGLGRGPISARLAEAFRAVGRLHEALGTATRAVELARRQDERGNEAAALLLVADICADLDGSSRETVEQRYAEARELGGELSMRPVVAGCHLGLGRFLQRIGENSLGGEQLATAARLFGEMRVDAQARPM